MRTAPRLALLLCLLLGGCSPPTPTAQVSAFTARDYAVAYLSTTSEEVLEIRFDLPSHRTRLWRVEVSPAGPNTVVRYTGPDVAFYVLPKGVAIPFPDSPEYTRTAALHGRITCIDPPLAAGFREGESFRCALEGVSFDGMGEVDSGWIELVMVTFPP